MQYLVKGAMVTLSNVIIGGFLGMYFKVMYAMLGSVEQQVLGLVLFLVGVVVAIVYLVLLKKFVMGEETSMLLPMLALILGIWITWNYYIYV